MSTGTEQRLKRRQVGPTVRYEGRVLSAHHMGPDLLAYVDGVELAAFYLNVESAHAAGRRYVDEQIKEEKKKQDKTGGAA